MRIFSAQEIHDLRKYNPPLVHVYTLHQLSGGGKQPGESPRLKSKNHFILEITYIHHGFREFSN